VTRQYSFTGHSVNTPSVPQPGDRLDGEIDRTNAAVNELSNFLEQTFDANGNLLPGSVALDRLEEGAIQTIEVLVAPNLQPFVTRAEAHAIYAGVAATDADASAQEAAAHAQSVLANAELAKAAADAAALLGRQVREDAATITVTQTEIDNFTNDAEGFANSAHNDARLAGAWAEYMEGGNPLPAMVFAHTSITGQHWSSRWWATQAAAAFGAMSSLYLGAWPTPPSTTATGQPIPIGAIYYNTTNHQAYVWDGTAWNPFYAPTKALTLTLTYIATADQTSLSLQTPDITGNIFVLDAVYTEPLEVHLNGVRTVYDAPAGSGDYLVNGATSTVTFSRPLALGTVIGVDILASVNTLPPNRTTTRLLLDFNVDPVTGTPGQIDGIRKTFPLALATGSHSAVTVAASTEILVFIDGVTQQPDVAYTTSGTNITFTEAPTVDCVNWTTWFAPGAIPPAARDENGDPIPGNSPAILQGAGNCPCGLGTVTFSLLNETDFMATLSANDAYAWRAADGSSIAGTDLATHLNRDTLDMIPTQNGLHAYVRVMA
jgi:hypothetical protein